MMRALVGWMLGTIWVLTGCSGGSGAPPVASASVDFPLPRIWGTGDSVSPDLELLAGTYQAFVQSFERGNEGAHCPIVATLKAKADSADTWTLTEGLQPSTDMPLMLAGPSRSLDASTYQIEVTTACEWLIILRWRQ
jgi:hypothetical protein